MSDVTEGLDLLGDWLDAKGYTEEAGLCTKAMDEINRLRDELADTRERCKLNYELGVQRGKMDAEALRAENAKLQAEIERFRNPTPEMIAAAWSVFKRDNQKNIGPGPGFVEAMKAMAARAAMGDCDAS